MKKYIISLLAILIALPAMAIAECEVKFEWFPQIDMGVAGYMIFCRQAGEEFDYDDPVWEGDETFSNCTIGGLEETKTYYFVIRSVDMLGNQSYDSPEVEFTYAGSDDGSDAGLGGDDDGGSGGGSSTSFSSCFLQTLSGSSTE